MFVSFEIDSVVFECLSVCSCVFLSESEIKSDRMRDCGCYVVEQCFSTWVPRNPEVPLIYRWVP